MSSRRKKIPAFVDEAEERAFWESHDSTDYLDWSQAQRITLPNLKPTTQSISLRAAGFAAGEHQGRRQ